MDEERLAKTLDAATGEAVFAAFGQSALWILLVKKGVISHSEAAAVIDHTLLLLERARGQHQGPDSGPGAIDHARSRLEGLLASLRSA